MRKYFTVLIISVFCALGHFRSAVAADVSIDFFYDSLAPHGDWIEVADYGYVWSPHGTDANWRPYTAGNWVYTDAGWTWVSDEPYGWAVYHYGRWVKIKTVGWAWVPDTEWGPAWVSWRRSKTHVGWAPLPPEARLRPNVGISIWADAYYDIGPAYYSFVEVKNFGAPKLRTVILPPQQNVTIITETTNITNITYTNDVVFNGGPEYDVIVRESAQPIRRLRLDRQVDVSQDVRTGNLESAKTEIQGDQLRVLAPQLQGPAAAAAPRTVAKHIQKAEVNRGWQDAGNPAQVEKLHAKVRQEAKAPAELPPKPKFEKAAVAANAPKPAAGTTPATAPEKDPASKAATNTATPGQTGNETPATTPSGGATPANEKTPAATPETKATPTTSPAPETGKKGKNKTATPAATPSTPGEGPGANPPAPEMTPAGKNKAPAKAATPASVPDKKKGVTKQSKVPSAPAPAPEEKVAPAENAPATPAPEAKPEKKAEGKAKPEKATKQAFPGEQPQPDLPRGEEKRGREPRAAEAPGGAPGKPEGIERKLPKREVNPEEAAKAGMPREKTAPPPQARPDHPTVPGEQPEEAKKAKGKKGEAAATPPPQP